MDPNETALELIARSDNRIQMVAYGRSEDDLRAVLTHPLTSIGSDGLAMDPDGPSSAGRPHPRSFGCYPRLLGRYVRDAGLLTLERGDRDVHLATRGPGRAGRSRSDRRGCGRGPRGLRPGHRSSMPPRSRSRRSGPSGSRRSSWPGRESSRTGASSTPVGPAGRCSHDRVRVRRAARRPGDGPGQPGDVRGGPRPPDGRRRADLRFGLGLGPPHGGRPLPDRAVDAADLAGRPGAAGATRPQRARQLVPPPGADGQDVGQRPGAERRAVHPRLRRRLARGRVPRLRLPVPADPRADRPDGRGAAPDQDDVDRVAGHVRGRVLQRPARRGASRAPIPCPRS